MALGSNPEAPFHTLAGWGLVHGWWGWENGPGAKSPSLTCLARGACREQPHPEAGGVGGTLSGRS